MITENNGALHTEVHKRQLHRPPTPSNFEEPENGEVHLSFVAAPDDVAVRTENGPVTVELPAATYRVTTNTESGDVRVEVPEDANSPHTVTAETDNGAITLLSVDHGRSR